MSYPQIEVILPLFIQIVPHNLSIIPHQRNTTIHGREEVFRMLFFHFLDQLLICDHGKPQICPLSTVKRDFLENLHLFLQVLRIVDECHYTCLVSQFLDKRIDVWQSFFYWSIH